MASKTYPGVEALIRRVRLRGAWRIFPYAHRRTPLGAGPGHSRFAAPGGDFLVIYAAPYFETSFREAIVRDDFDGAADRSLARPLIADRACVQISTTTPLDLLNITDGRAQSFGIASAVRHGTDYVASQAFSKVVYDETPADGILYNSRFNEAAQCVVVFDRAFDAKVGKQKLDANTAFKLEQHPDLEAVLKKLRLKLSIV